MTEFSLDVAKQLVESDEQFPVDFDAAFVWLGYSRKDSAKRAFLNSGFIEGVDFSSVHNTVEREIGSTNIEKISLTIECFKMWAMLSKTEQGNKVRLYFLECEKVAKQVTNIPDTFLELMQQMQQQLNVLAVDHEKLNQLQEEKQQLELAGIIHPGCADVLKEENKNNYADDLVVTAEQYLRLKKLDNTHLDALRKKAAQYYRMGKQSEPTKNSKNQTIYVGSDIIYLDEALAFILGLI